MKPSGSASSAPASSESVDAALASSLESLDDAHNYRDWISSLCRPHLGARILEVGAGHGTFTSVLAADGHVTAVEPGDDSAVQLTARFADDERVTVVHGLIEAVSVNPTERFDAAVLINVLEHIEDDHAALDQLHERLADDGRLCLWVPAFDLLYSDFDRELGHHRRYRKGELENLVNEHGFDVLDVRYTNLPGWFSWLLLVRLLRKRPTNPKLVATFDRLIVPPVAAIERRIRPPFGQSIFLAARRRPE
ncbi:MAG: SAM-dependent methyltransferase [Ilumatobacter sp.]